MGGAHPTLTFTGSMSKRQLLCVKSLWVKIVEQLTFHSDDREEDDGSPEGFPLPIQGPQNFTCFWDSECITRIFLGSRKRRTGPKALEGISLIDWENPVILWGPLPPSCRLGKWHEPGGTLPELLPSPEFSFSHNPFSPLCCAPLSRHTLLNWQQYVTCKYWTGGFGGSALACHNLPYPIPAPSVVCGNIMSTSTRNKTE